MTPPALSTFTLTAKGHANIQATHSSTVEVTTDSHLTRRGDCIIGVNASHSAQALQPFFENILRTPRCRIRTILKVGKTTDTIQGWISSAFPFSDSSSLVWRKSVYFDDRTIAIECDKAAKDLDRHLVTALQNPQSLLEVRLAIDYDT